MKPCRALLAGWLLMLFSPSAYSQSNLAGISGVVSDPSGSSIAGAAVTVRNMETDVAVTAATNSSGYYNVENLAIGQYTLTIEHPGFRGYVRQKITLTTGQQLGLDVSLAVGNASESVTVTGEVPLTETRSSDVSQLFESKSIEGRRWGTGAR